MFPEIDTSDWTPARDEQMGSKEKLWIIDPDGIHWLLKRPRGNSGEDWAEKIAAQLAELLGVPHALVELARHRSDDGSITRSFLPARLGAQLVHGNELLIRQNPDYPRQGETTFTTSMHTVARVVHVLARDDVQPPEGNLPDGVTSAVGVFVGYTLLDAWIGNTDRHHENWGVIDYSLAITALTPGATPGPRYNAALFAGKHQVIPLPRPGHWAAGRHPAIRRLAPTFDHGSSLGRNEPDHRKETRMATRDMQQNVAAYCRKTPSRFFEDERQRKPMHPLDVFRAALPHDPQAATAWLDRLKMVTDDQVQQVVSAVPDHRMSQISKQFALAMLEFNKERLLQNQP